MTPWPHQLRGVTAALEAIQERVLATVLVSPTGTGKTKMQAMVCERLVGMGRRVAYFTNRKILTWQTSDTLDGLDLDHGLVAGGFDMDLLKRIQVCSIQATVSRVYQREAIPLPPVDCAIVDEAHGKAYDPVLVEYRKRGTPLLGWTATPTDLGRRYDRMVVVCTNSEGRRCGALVPCHIFAPSEPGPGVTVTKLDEERLWNVFGDVFGHWFTLNTERRPTLLWAPGVRESRWFVQRFAAKGVPAAHIDGDTPDDERRATIKAHKSGEIVVLSSCGVLREGFDAPWASHGILAQPCGKLGGYLQLVGRLLRRYPGKDKAILQDHAGAWHRHGSPNIDREWELGGTSEALSRAWRKAVQAGEAEGVVCPKCAAVRRAGPKCHHCGYEHTRSVRMVRTRDGDLVRKTGNVVKKRRQMPEDARLWLSCLFAGARSNLTVGQCAVWFRRRCGHSLPPTVPPQPPADSVDWMRHARELYPWLARKKN